MPVNYAVLSAFIVGAIILYIILWVFAKPIKTALKFVLSGGIGCAAIAVYNLIAASFGMPVGINIYTAAVCALLGVPGFILIVLTRILIG